MELKIVRYPQRTCTPGIMYVDGVRQCFTLEWPKEGAKYACIPSGTYEVVGYDSPHFKRRVLLVQNVPDRTAIEIHMGNTIADSEGCILVGQRRNADGSTLLSSIAALDALMAKVTFPLTLTVTEIHDGPGTV